jgi:hypothetical protein
VIESRTGDGYVLVHNFLSLPLEAEAHAIFEDLKIQAKKCYDGPQRNCILSKCRSGATSNISYW